jgi:antitoxin StbD
MKPSIAPKLNSKRPTTYFLSAKLSETLLEKLDDASLISVVKSRRGGKTVKVKLEDL